MFFTMLAAMGGETAAVGTVTSVPVVSTADFGECTGGFVSTPAAILVSWTITNPSASLYSAKLYENGILMSTQDTTASMSWNKTVVGNIAEGSASPWSADWTYRVDVVRKADSQVVDSKESAEWTQAYGGCP